MGLVESGGSGPEGFKPVLEGFPKDSKELGSGEGSASSICVLDV